MIVDDAIARDLCIATSRCTGLEYVVVFDMFTGEVIGQRSGKPDSAGFSLAVREAALDSQRKLKVVHSHPQDKALSLSPVDLIVLWDYEGIYELEAVTPDGSWFLARAGAHSRELSKAYVGRAFNDLYKICLNVKGHDPLSSAEARYLDEASTDLYCRALAKRGTITYECGLSRRLEIAWNPHSRLRDELVRLTVARSRIPQRY
ncbi:hypothetical protein ASG35_23745 [Burkholderia sp. Leaf177]|uniref:hypothetical protein n=1 Tax=Burkholderia sp. Leaf177 TaxID=1736287 RepID=UPI0006F9BBD0|nr:hypothetical protein [Burkholderia sp. Leaf177]KQR87141.1 hypothetical protein ASG35_23745 [Burkholderia sp. Leaf177]